jgi:hypothetical protein
MQARWFVCAALIGACSKPERREPPRLILPTAPPASDSGTAEERDPMDVAAEAATAGLREGGLSIVASHRGVYLDLNGPGCTPQVLQRVASMPPVLGPLLQVGYRFITCGGESEYVEQRLPPAGVPVPEPVEWNRSFVATRFGVGRQADHPAVYCTGLREHPEEGVPGSVRCTRTLEACRNDEANARALDPRSFLPCTLTPSLWCFDTSGTERVCSLSQRDCENQRAQIEHGRGPRCERRWSI